jgi:hypothetical protein
VALKTFFGQNGADVAVVVERFGGAKRSSRGASGASDGEEWRGDEDGGAHGVFTGKWTKE